MVRHTRIPRTLSHSALTALDAQVCYIEYDLSKMQFKPFFFVCSSLNNVASTLRVFPKNKIGCQKLSGKACKPTWTSWTHQKDPPNRKCCGKLDKVQTKVGFIYIQVTGLEADKAKPKQKGLYVPTFDRGICS